MYMMVCIDISQFKDIENDVDFCKKLLAEEYILCMPGSCFFFDNGFRLVLCHPPELFVELGSRLKKFVEAHKK